jgi:hypothetical protein
VNYKDRINTGFASCTLLAYARDHCRERDVRLYLLPETDDCVGVTDGTDAWIAPRSASLFSVNVDRIIADFRAGKGLPKPARPGAPRTRRRLAPEDAAFNPGRARRELV